MRSSLHLGLTLSGRAGYHEDSRTAGSLSWFFCLSFRFEDEVPDRDGLVGRYHRLVEVNHEFEDFMAGAVDE